DDHPCLAVARDRFELAQAGHCRCGHGTAPAAAASSARRRFSNSASASVLTNPSINLEISPPSLGVRLPSATALRIAAPAAAADAAVSILGRLKGTGLSRRAGATLSRM